MVMLIFLGGCVKFIDFLGEICYDEVMRNKVLATLCSILMVFGFVSVMTPTPVAAAPIEENKQECGAPVFLGFRPWYASVCDNDGVKQPTNEDETIAFVWTIVLNILYDLFLAVGYLALAMVVYGGFLYIMAQGDPAKAMKGQKTLTTAVIGTVITMVATVIVNTAKVVIGISGNGWNQGNFSKEQLGSVFNWLYAAAGIVAVAFIIKAGVEYVISRGDPGKVQKATRSIIYAVVGLLIVLFAALITQFVISAIGGATVE